MYELDYLDEHLQWIKLIQDNDIKVIDKAIYKLIDNKTHLRVLKDNIVMVFLNGTDYQYFIFHKKYTQGRSLEYDYVKEYFKRKKE